MIETLTKKDIIQNKALNYAIDTYGAISGTSKFNSIICDNINCCDYDTLCSAIDAA